MPDEDEDFRGCLVLNFAILWRHVETIFCILTIHCKVQDTRANLITVGVRGLVFSCLTGARYTIVMAW